MDLAVELSRHASQVWISTRSGTWVIPRFSIFGQPSDHFASNRVSSVLPLWLREKVVQFILNLQMGNLENFGLKPAHSVFSAHPTINAELVGRIGVGSIIVKANVSKITPTGAEFEDGTKIECDTIIYCTGYNISFPYFSQSAGIQVIENNLPLYKFVFPPKVPNVAFVGLVQPLGAIMPISEIQCRWISRVFSGKQSLPSVEQMEQDIAEKRQAMQKRYKKSQRHTIQVDYVPYMDEISEQVGCEVNLKSILLKYPKLTLKYLTTPLTPVWFRLFGPHIWPKAPAVIEESAASAFLPYQTRNVPKESSSFLLSPLFFLALIVLILSVLYHVLY